jgi:hypothetical protein
MLCDITLAFISMNENILIPVVLVPLAILLLILDFTRQIAILTQWAIENGFKILDSERRFFRRGPFFWTTSRGRVVYYVRVKAEDGEIRSGWVRCGNWWLGVFINQAEVRWDE